MAPMILGVLSLRSLHMYGGDVNLITEDAWHIIELMVVTGKSNPHYKLTGFQTLFLKALKHLLNYFKHCFQAS